MKKLLTTFAILSAILMAGCENLNNDPSPSETNPNVTAAGRQASNARTSNARMQETVLLGGAGNFVILSQSGITNVPSSAITGDVGSSPITGAAIGVTCAEVAGTIYQVDAAGPACFVTSATMLTTAVLDMGTAYTDAAGRVNPDYLNLGSGEIGGLTLTPGLYNWGTGVTISTDVTLKGGPNAIWIFQVNGTLTTASAVKIILSGGAQAKNIFWQVTGAVTLGTTSHFEGIILGQTYIALQTGASINGRTLAQTAVTLDQNTVTQPSQNKGKGRNK